MLAIIPEPVMTEERHDRNKLQIFLESAALQHAKSSISRWRALSQAQPTWPGSGIRNVTLNQSSSKTPEPPMVLVKSHLGSDCDVRSATRLKICNIGN